MNTFTALSDIEHAVEFAEGVGFGCGVVGVFDPLAVDDQTVAVSARRDVDAGLPDAEFLVFIHRRGGGVPVVKVAGDADLRASFAGLDEEDALVCFADAVELAELFLQTRAHDRRLGGRGDRGVGRRRYG